MFRPATPLCTLALILACNGDDTATSDTATTTGSGTTTETTGPNPTTTTDASATETTTGETSTTSTSTVTDATTDPTTTTTDATTDATTTSTTMAPGCIDDSECAAMADACNDATCEDGSCVVQALADGTPCADDDLCNGDETCLAGACAPGDPILCDDDLFCNGAETCDPATGCVAGDPPALTDEIECTIDACDEDLDTVSHTPDDGACGDGLCAVGMCDVNAGCMDEDNPYLVCLTGDPDPSLVFNTIESTYYFSNNLSNAIWHAMSNRILSGHYSSLGYYSFAAEMNGYSQLPTEMQTERFTRLIHIPATRTVIHGDTQFATPAASVRIGVLDPDTGVISGMQAAVFSDGFAGTCNLFSNDNMRFFCFDGVNIRKYDTAEGSPMLTFVESTPLSQPLFDSCDTFCFGGTFAWDGKFYYFPYDGNSASDRRYSVYDEAGVFQQTYTATGNGAIDSTYFDWSVGHYTIHDGFGGRSGGNIYTWGGNGDDSQCYGPKSADHQ